MTTGKYATEEKGGHALRLPRRIINQLLDHARAFPGQEVCGLISARDGAALRAIPVANISPRPEHRYAMDPAGQIAALRAMRESGEDLLAIYHSHPVSPAAPSSIDIAEAGYPDTTYLIISLNTKGVLEMRGFRIRAGGVREVVLEIQESR
ncbi:MAG: M67 family metallopeptidase [Gammaproteobacteria bacterium]|nr:M67 family metallopeptidase [Gammaproteobacteria bacterium]